MEKVVISIVCLQRARHKDMLTHVMSPESENEKSLLVVSARSLRLKDTSAALPAHESLTQTVASLSCIVGNVGCMCRIKHDNLSGSAAK